MQNISSKHIEILSPNEPLGQEIGFKTQQMHIKDPTILHLERQTLSGGPLEPPMNISALQT